LHGVLIHHGLKEVAVASERSVGGASTGKLPRGGQGEEPHPCQPVVLARGDGRRLALLKGQFAPSAAAGGTFEIARCLPHDHVAAVLGRLRGLGLEELIDPVRPGSETW
jgi:hypothetical protein